MPPNLEWISALPIGLQIAVMVGVGIGMILLAKNGYLAGKKEPPVTSKDVVLTASGITDLAPFREAVIEVRRVADELGTIRQIMAEDAEERQDYRQWRKGFEAGQRDQPAPRRRT